MSPSKTVLQKSSKLGKEAQPPTPNLHTPERHASLSFSTVAPPLFSEPYALTNP